MNITGSRACVLACPFIGKLAEVHWGIDLSKKPSIRDSDPDVSQRVCHQALINTAQKVLSLALFVIVLATPGLFFLLTPLCITKFSVDVVAMGYDLYKSQSRRAEEVLSSEQSLATMSHSQSSYYWPLSDAPTGSPSPVDRSKEEKMKLTRVLVEGVSFALFLNLCPPLVVLFDAVEALLALKFLHEAYRPAAVAGGSPHPAMTYNPLIVVNM